MDLQAATKKIDAYLAKLESDSNKSESDKLSLQVLDELTREYEFGWVFFYQSKHYIESGNFTDMLMGNAPLIVDKHTGEIHVTGTAYSIETYVDNYIRTGKTS